MKVGINTTRGRVGMAAALVVALVSLFGSPARAAVTGHQGAMDHTLVVNCTSIELGDSYTEWGMTLVAGAGYDDAVPLQVGDVFYAGVYVAAVGNPCPTQSFYPDLTLPPGISTAISATHPIQCWHETFGDTTTDTRDYAHCPADVGAPAAGGTVGLPSTGLSDSGGWPIPQGEGYEVDVPLVATRAYTGAISFPTQTVDGNLNQIWAPDVTVAIAAAPAPPPAPTPPACTLRWSSTKVARSRVGLSLHCDKAATTATYARLTISLGRHRTKTARTSVVRMPAAAGRATAVHLTLPAAVMTALRHHQTVRAQAVNTGKGAGGSSTVRTAIQRLTK